MYKYFLREGKVMTTMYNINSNSELFVATAILPHNKDIQV